MGGYNDIPDAPWIREAEAYGMPEDPEEEMEFWRNYGGPIPHHVLARMNGAPSCMVDDSYWGDNRDD